MSLLPRFPSRGERRPEGAAGVEPAFWRPPLAAVVVTVRVRPEGAPAEVRGAPALVAVRVVAAPVVAAVRVVPVTGVVPPVPAVWLTAGVRAVLVCGVVVAGGPPGPVSVPMAPPVPLPVGSRDCDLVLEAPVRRGICVGRSGLDIFRVLMGMKGGFLESKSSIIARFET